MLRFAFVPAGDMTIDDLRIAMVNFIVAKQRQEPFLVRMDDADKAVFVEGKDTECMQILEKFSLVHDQVYHQSEHQSIHQTLALRLLEEKKAFVCTCSDTAAHQCSGSCKTMTEDAYSRLKQDGTPFVIRIKTPGKAIAFSDIILGEITTAPGEIGEPVLLNTDAMPTSLFASACDDMLSNITMLIRHLHQLQNTAAEIYIKTILGYTGESTYAHIPALIQTPTLISLLKEGYLPDAIINYLVLLSNSHTSRDSFTLPDAIQWFSLEAIPSDPVPFKMEVLQKLNREHLLRMDDRTLSTLFGFADVAIGKLAKVYLETGKANTVTEVDTYIRAIFSPKSFQGEYQEMIGILKNIIWEAPMFDTFEAFEAYLVKQSTLQGDALYTPLRVLLTNQTDGPALETIYPYIKSYLLEVIS